MLILALLLGLFVPAVSAVYYGQCGNGLTWWVSEDGVLTIEGVGDMDDYAAASEVPWASYNDVLRDVFIGEKVASIGQNAFAQTVIENIYYHGTQEMWDEVTIGSGNEGLSDATVHYMPWFYIYTGDCFHTPEAFCNCCNMTATGGTTPCVDDDWDYICDLCGGELCTHAATTVYYTPLGDMRHTAITICTMCEQVLDNITEYCFDINGDYTCELCWYSACAHTRYQFGYYPMGGGLHSASTTCADCGITIEEQMAICVDADQNYRCDYCGDSTCTHKKLNSTYVPIENNRHSVSSVCAQCGKNMGTDTGRCVDLDGDGLCQFCKRNMCPHTELTETYATLENGTHQKTVTCVCGEQMEQSTEDCTDADTDGLCDGCGAAVEMIETFSVVGANMTLGNDLKINFLIRKTDIKDGYVAYVSQAGAEPVRLELWDYNSLYYAVSCSVAAKEMTDVLSVEIYDEAGNLVSEPFARTIRQYAMTLLNNASQKAALKSVIVDMLNYGTEAQKYFGYHEDDYANAEVTAEQQETFATAEVECVNNQQAITNFVGSNLSLEDSILLNVFFKVTYSDALTATVSFTDYLGKEVTAEAEASKYSSMTKVVVDRIVLADAKRPVTVTVYDGDTVVGQGVESVESYIARNMTGATATINTAIMKFAASAYHYLGGTN